MDYLTRMQRLGELADAALDGELDGVDDAMAETYVRAIAEKAELSATWIAEAIAESSDADLITLARLASDDQAAAGRQVYRLLLRQAKADLINRQVRTLHPVERAYDANAEHKLADDAARIADIRRTPI